MVYILIKIFKIFLFPLTWVIGLLVAGYFLKSKLWRRILFVVSMLMLLVFMNKPLLNFAQYKSTQAYSEQVDPIGHYRVAIVMGGFAHMNETTGQLCYFQDRGSRIWEPVRLLHQGKVDKILVTGDQTSQVDKDGNNTADVFVKYMQQQGVPDTCWIFEQHARNTHENAVLSIAILDSLGYKPSDCLLVTSASHMQRSLDEFAKADWQLTPFAVNIYRKPGKPRLQDFRLYGPAIIQWDELFNEYFGNILYKLIY